jgi:nitroreductase
METMKAILSRRSIRKYKPDPISEDLVTELLKAAMSAPSADNKQPWHFVVIRDHAILDRIPEFHMWSHMLTEAALAIIVCGDLKLADGKTWWVQDCSAATENILIAANNFGLGAVWLGLYPNEARVAGIQKLLSMPQVILPLSIIALGYPAENKMPEDRYIPSRIHYEKW